MFSKPQLYETLARGSALLAGGIVFILYLFFVLDNPYSGSDLAQDSVFLMTVVTALAGLQIWAAWNKMPIVVIIAFIFSFLPTGMFMMNRPDIYRWIGITHLAYLVVALFTWLDRRQYRAN